MNLFGNVLTKMIVLVVGGAIVIAAGAELLASVASVVLAFRLGDFVPLLAIAVLTIVIQTLTNHVAYESRGFILMTALAYAITGYLAFTVFLIALPYGLIVSFLASGALCVISSISRKQKLGIYWKQVMQSLSRSQNGHHGLPNRQVPLGDGTSFKLNSFHTVMILEEGGREGIVQLLRERPLLPVSFTHYEDCDVIFIADENDPMRCEQVMKLLKDSSIGVKGPASPLLAEAVQMVPILDSRNGLKFEDYRLTRDEKTISSLLVQAPSRMTVFPSPLGLGILIPAPEVPGMNVERLKRGCEADILLNREYSRLEEVEKSIESTA